MRCRQIVPGFLAESKTPAKDIENTSQDVWIYRVFFITVPPLKYQSTEKLILARLGVSRTIYVNVDSPNLGFSYSNFSGEAQCKKTPCICARGLSATLEHLSTRRSLQFCPLPTSKPHILPHFCTCRGKNLRVVRLHRWLHTTTCHL